MPIPSPADFRDRTKKHSEVREMLAEMAGSVASKDYVSSTGEASIVGGNLTNINYTTEDKKLTFSGTVYVFTGTNRYQLQTPQVIDLPNFSPYRLEYVIASNTVIAKPYSLQKTEGNIVVGFMTASATGLKTLDFGFAQDGVAQDALELAKKYTDENKARYTSVNVSTNPIITDALSKYQILTFWGTLTKDTEVIFPKHVANYVLQNSVTLAGFKLTIKTEGQTTPAIEFPSTSRKVVFNTGTALYDVGNDKAELKSPAFTGTPTAPTPSTSSNDSTLSTTKYVKDFVDEKFNRVANINIGSAVGDVVLNDFQLRSGILNIFGNPPEPVNLVFPEDTNKTYLMRVVILPSTVVRAKLADTDTMIELGRGSSYLSVNSLGFTVPYGSKAENDSPTFTGTPKLFNTPTTSSSDEKVANTQFVKRAIHSVTTVTVSDATTQLTGLDSNTVVVEGALTQSRELVIAETPFSCTIINKTTGGKDIILKGAGQYDPQTYVSIKANQGKKVYVKGMAVYEALGGDASGQLPVATANVLGGIKVGSGLSITPSGTLSATGSSPSDVTPLKFAGNFLNGSSYAVGDVVRHGSGVYQVTDNVTQAESPQNDARFTKIGHNEAAGELGKVDVLSNTLEYITYQSEVPYLLSKGGNLVFSRGTNKIGISKDYGRTWELKGALQLTSGYWVKWVDETDDGELLCGVGQLDDPNPDKALLYKSTGWNEISNLTPEWEVVHTIQRSGAIVVDWGISHHNNIVLMAEYGLHKGRPGASDEEYAKYAYLSKDYGKTWKTIFNLDDFVTTNGVHLHGICFDKYWNRIWISHGDGAGGGTNGLYYSDDLGETWVSALATSGAGVNFSQSVGIKALPTCILFASDSTPNGVQRIDRAQGRTPVKGYYTVEGAYTVPNSNPNGISQILSTGYKAQWLPNAPYIWVFAAETIAGEIGCVLSWDGWIFHEIWVSDIKYKPSSGAKSVVGITPENTIIVSGHGVGVDGGDSKNWKRTIKVSLDAV